MKSKLREFGSWLGYMVMATVYTGLGLVAITCDRAQRIVRRVKERRNR